MHCEWAAALIKCSVMTDDSPFFAGIIVRRSCYGTEVPSKNGDN